MASHNITLTRTAQVPDNSGNVTGYSVTITASNGNTGTPNEIFRMNQRPLDPTQGTQTSDFSGVCSFLDLQNLPINGPNQPATLFRVASFTHTYTNQSAGDNDWVAIQTAVQSLMNELAAADELDAPEVVTITSN